MKVFAGVGRSGDVEGGADTAVQEAVMRREARDGGSTRGDEGHVTLGRRERSGG